MTTEKIDAINIGEYFKKSDFTSEKELTDFLKLNMNTLIKELGYEKALEVEEESFIIPAKRFGANKPRVDFKVKVSEKLYILIECKNPKHVYREMLNSIAQMMGYIAIAENCGLKVDKYWVVTTRFDPECARIIKRFNLPIGIAIVSNNKIATWGN
jgi:hypothetical protein